MFHNIKIGIEVKSMKPANASQMRDHIAAYLDRICKRFDLKHEYRIEKASNQKLRLYTDGTIYGLIYDTSANEFPQLMRDANAEFGVENPIPARDAYYAPFLAMVEKYGWHIEHYGGGVLDIYRMTE